MQETKTVAALFRTSATSERQTIERQRHSIVESEHGQTLTTMPQEICAPKLRELARQVDPDRPQQVNNLACGLSMQTEC